jgi:hypothetical protein
MTTNYTYQPGDIIIDRLELRKLDGEKAVDIKEQILTIDIYESILSPVITGSIFLQDSIELRESFPIIADRCFIRIHFSSPIDKNRELRKLDLLISNVTNSTMNAEAKYNIYQLVLTSIEILANSNGLLNRGFFNKPISGYVTDILKNDISTNKKYIVEPTKGPQTIDSVIMKPFQAIDLFKFKAVSTRYESSLFVFFENRFGFIFAPVEHLLSDPIYKIIDGLYFFDSDSSSDVKNISYKNILAYTHINQQSTSQLVSEGGLNNKTVSVDLRTGGVRTINYSHARSNFQGPPGSKSQILPTFEAKNNKQAKLYNHIKSTTNPDNFLEDKLGKAKSFFELMMQNILRIAVPGDEYISAGHVIDVKVPNPSGTTEKLEISDYVSGPMLISSARHMIERDEKQGGFSYYTSMELVNPFFGRG